MKFLQWLVMIVLYGLLACSNGDETKPPSTGALEVVVEEAEPEAPQPGEVETNAHEVHDLSEEEPQ